MDRRDAGPVVLWDGRIDLHGEWVAGIRTWRWTSAPTGLSTRRQLTGAGRRPAGQEPYGRLVCRRGRRWAWLYRDDLTRPKRAPSTAVLAALDKAMAARRWCPSCRQDAGHCVPRIALGMCVDCWEERHPDHGGGSGQVEDPISASWTSAQAATDSPAAA